jgi:hypothetical protein
LWKVEIIKNNETIDFSTGYVSEREAQICGEEWIEEQKIINFV